MKKRRRLVVLTVAAGALLAGILATTGYGRSAHPSAKSAASIEVLSLWGGSEKDAFTKVTDQFTKDSGINVTYTSARDFIPEISTRLAAGNPPDIAIVPRPGYLSSLAQKGALKELSTMGITSAYLSQRFAASWIGFGTVGGKLYGVPTKASSKSVIWYKPDSFKRYKFKIPTTWSQLLAITKAYKAKGLAPWAIGDGPNQSQWVLTDWFENLYARTAGAVKYQALFTGKLPFTDPTVVTALQNMVQIVNGRYALGGIQGVLGTSFVDGIGNVFGKNAKAQLYMEGGFVGGIAIGQVNPALKPGVTIDFFPWPTVNPKADSPVIGGADYAVAFKDNPEVRRFLQYITSPAAGQIWVSTGAVETVNKLVSGSAYPNSLTRKEGQQLAAAKIVRFDGSDQMPGAFGDTWGYALQKVIQNPSASNIKKILAGFQSQIASQWGK